MRRAWRRSVLVLGVMVLGIAGLGIRSEAQSTSNAPQTSEAATRQYAAAVALQNRDLFELAAEEWQKFLKIYSQDQRAARARHYRGLCLLKLKQYAPALTELEQLLAEAPKLPAGALVAEAADGTKTDLLPATYLYAGLCELNLGQAGQAALLERAQKTFATLGTKYPKSKFSAQAIFYQGEALYAAGRKADAVKLYDEVARQFPKDTLAPDALYALGVTQAELNDSAAAEASFARFLKSYGDHRLAAEVKMRSGEALLQQNKLDEAAKQLAAAVASPDFSLADHALMRQAFCRYLQKQYADASTLYSSLLQKFPQSPYRSAASLGIGKCAYMQRQYPAARTTLAKLTSLDGDIGAEATHWLARAYLKEKQPAEALKALEPQLTKIGTAPAAKGEWNVQLQLDAADALYDQPDRQREAQAAYARLAEQNAQHALAPEALYMAGFAALGLADYDATAQRAADFLQRYPENALAPDVGYLVAEAELLRGQHAAAAKAYAALLTKHATHRDAQAWQLRRALALVLDRQYAEAVKVLEPQAAKFADPEQRAEANYLLGLSYTELNQPAQATAALQASLKAAPKWRQADETLVALAVAQRQAGQQAAARATLERVLKEFPQSAILDRVNYRLGEYAYAAGDYRAATDAYRRVLKETPNSALAPHARYGLAWAEYRAGDASAALTTLDALLDDKTSALKPTDELLPRARYARAVVRHAQKQYPAAITDLETFLAGKPAQAERSDARYLLGLCQAAAERPDAAIATFQQLLKDDPQYSGLDKVLNELAWTYKTQKKEQEAADTFARLVKERSDSPLATEALFHLGEHRYQREEYKQASKDFYAVSQKSPQGTLGENSVHLLGWSYFKQGDYESAAATFAAQRSNFPQGALLSDAAYMEGESLFNQGKYKESIACYEQVSQPKARGLSVLALLHSGQAAAQLKQWDQALRYLERAEKVDSSSEYLGEVLYEQAWAKQNLGKTDEALKLYEAVTEQTSTEAAARARFMIGELYFDRKDHNQAVKEFFKVEVYGFPQWQAAAQYEAGRCFEVLGKTDQARRSYKEVVEKFPDSDRAALARQRLATLSATVAK